MATPTIRLQNAKNTHPETFNDSYYYMKPYDRDYEFMTLAMDTDYNYINNSNDWTCLLDDQNRENIIHSIRNDLLTQDYKLIEKDVIPIIPVFRTGIHGYSYIYNVLYQLLTSNNNIGDFHILLYKNTFSGIMDIISYFLKNGYIQNPPIFIEENILYKFKSMHIIPNKLHGFFEDIEMWNNINNIIINNIIKYAINNTIPTISYDNICILKYGELSSSIGVFEKPHGNIFCKNNNYNDIDLSQFNEIQIINMMTKCKNIVLAYGSSFFKNILYLVSNPYITTIHVLCLPCFIHEHNYCIQNKFYDTINIVAKRSIKLNVIQIENSIDIEKMII